MAQILRDAGIEPARGPQSRMAGQEFLYAHWQVMAATDCFIVELRAAENGRIWIEFA